MRPDPGKTQSQIILRKRRPWRLKYSPDLNKNNSKLIIGKKKKKKENLKQRSFLQIPNIKHSFEIEIKN